MSLTNFPPPRAGDALRERVLTAARAAVESAARPSRTDRIYYSTTWRLAWVGVFASLVLIETLAVREVNGRGRTDVPSNSSISESTAAAEALGLPGNGWIGREVVTSRETSRDAAAEAL